MQIVSPPQEFGLEGEHVAVVQSDGHVSELSPASQTALPQTGPPPSSPSEMQPPKKHKDTITTLFMIPPFHNPRTETGDSHSPQKGAPRVAAPAGRHKPPFGRR